jgi:hypothetical protein
VQRYMKFIVAAVGAAVYAAQAAISDGHITGTEGYGILTAAVFVYLVPNKPAVEQPTERVERPY